MRLFPFLTPVFLAVLLNTNVKLEPHSFIPTFTMVWMFSIKYTSSSALFQDHVNLLCSMVECLSDLLHHGFDGPAFSLFHFSTLYCIGYLPRHICPPTFSWTKIFPSLLMCKKLLIVYGGWVPMNTKNSLVLHSSTVFYTHMCKAPILPRSSALDNHVSLTIKENWKHQDH